MFKQIQLTLYDIFGYLLPGSVILSALIVSYWSIFWPTYQLHIPTSLSLSEVIVLVFGSYLAGHLGQGLANLFENKLKARQMLELAIPLSDGLSDAVRSAAVFRFGESARSSSVRELFHLCDQALLHARSSGEREIFTYREGFYRGNSVALALLAISLILRFTRTPVLVDVFGVSSELGRLQIGLAVVLTGFGSYLAYKRYIRFAKHGYMCAFSRFLSLVAQEREKKSRSPEH